MTDLNENELKVLKSLVNSSAGNGHDFGWTDEYEDCGFTKHQMAGYIGQLTQKDYIRCSHLSDDPGVECNDVQFNFTLKAEELLNENVPVGFDRVYVDSNH